MTSYFTRIERLETLDNKTLFSLNQPRYGPIKYRYISTGAVYEGTWKGGFRDGFGTLIWSDGASYTGAWSLGHAHGDGKFIDKLGNIYEGPFYMSMAHGSIGRFTNIMGDSYVGSWKFDQKDGHGIEKWASDNLSYEGE